MIPTSSCIASVRSACTAYGFSPSRALERREHSGRGRIDLTVVDARHPRDALRVLGGVKTGAPAEDEQVGERVAAKPVRAVHPGGDLACCEEARHGRLSRIGVDANAAHDVVERRPDLHRRLRDVDVGELLELVVHRGQALLDVVGGPPRRDVEEDAAMRTAAARLDLGVDRARDLVTRQQIGCPAVVPLVLVPAVGFFLRIGRLCAEEVRDVAEHESLVLVVLQRSAVAAHALGDQDPAHARRPHHPGGMELRHLHVDEIGAGVERHAEAVAGVLPRVRGDLPRLADATGREHDGLRTEQHELSALAPVAERAGDHAILGEQAVERALHEHVDAAVHGVVLQRADHLETGAIADVREPRVAVTAEVALQDEAILRAVEQRAPLLELEYAVGCLLRVQLRHAPVVQQLAAAHGVAEVDLPVVFLPHVAHGRGDPALGHHRVRLAEQRLADERGLHAHRVRLDRRSQARAAGADHDDVVVVGLVLGH